MFPASLKSFVAGAGTTWKPDEEAGLPQQLACLYTFFSSKQVLAAAELAAASALHTLRATGSSSGNAKTEALNDILGASFEGNLILQK
jgi:hypothetical protein